MTHEFDNTANTQEQIPQEGSPIQQLGENIAGRYPNLLNPYKSSSDQLAATEKALTRSFTLDTLTQQFPDTTFSEQSVLEKKYYKHFREKYNASLIPSFQQTIAYPNSENSTLGVACIIVDERILKGNFDLRKALSNILNVTQAVNNNEEPIEIVLAFQRNSENIQNFDNESKLRALLQDDYDNYRIRSITLDKSKQEIEDLAQRVNAYLNERIANGAKTQQDMTTYGKLSSILQDQWNTVKTTIHEEITPEGMRRKIFDLVAQESFQQEVYEKAFTYISNPNWLRDNDQQLSTTINGIYFETMIEKIFPFYGNGKPLIPCSKTDEFWKALYAYSDRKNKTTVRGETYREGISTPDMLELTQEDGKPIIHSIVEATIDRYESRKLKFKITSLLLTLKRSTKHNFDIFARDSRAGLIFVVPEDRAAYFTMVVQGLEKVQKLNERYVYTDTPPEVIEITVIPIPVTHIEVTGLASNFLNNYRPAGENSLTLVEAEKIFRAEDIHRQSTDTPQDQK